MRSVMQAVLEPSLTGRTVRMTADIKVAGVFSTDNGSTYVKDENGNVFKIHEGYINTVIPVFKYEIITPKEWSNGPVPGQVWQVNGVDYAVMQEEIGIVMRPMSGNGMFNAVYPDMYESFLELNPVLIKQA